MKCTSCNQGTLQPAYLDDLFPCHTCTNCGGNLVLLSAYLSWLDTHPEVNFEDSCETAVDADDNRKVMLCPKTGSIMLKYRISKDTDHRLDLSPSINAIWMDRGEWDLIKSEGLAGQLNSVFTDTWQKKIRQAKTEDVLRAMYEREFGENYSKIQAFKDLIATMPNRSEVVAYLVSDNPYKA